MQEQKYWNMLATVIDAIITVPHYRSPEGDVLVSDFRSDSVGNMFCTRQVQPLSAFCLVPSYLGRPGLKKNEVARQRNEMNLAEGVTATSHTTYAMSKSELPGEVASVGWSHKEWESGGILRDRYARECSPTQSRAQVNSCSL
jgi:hypothetical protein